ncbi:MAG: DUF4384 domain-containing protein [Planctomycetota bacterium]
MKRALRCGASFLGMAAVCLMQWLTVTDALAGEITFRDLARKYFKDGEGADLAKLVGFSHPVKEVLALEYKVLLFADGKETVVDPKAHDFRVGDKIRLAIEPLNDCYVYISHVGASGKSTFLLPAEAEQPPLAKAGKPMPLPLDGFFEFSEPTGEETVLVVATEKPVADRAVLASVLTKKPDEKFTPEEEAVRKTIKATVKKAMKSAREKQKELLGNTVMYRGLTTGTAIQDMIKDVHTRGVTEGTFEEPSRDGTGGTCAMYISTEKGGQSRLLVTIPLKSSSK